jgi:anti-sigma factor RsiW
MNCRDVRSLTPLYLSGEMDGETRGRFAAHLAACPACGREIEEQAAVDERLVKALLRESPDTTRIERTVRRRIADVQSRRRWMARGAIAASVLTAISGIYGLWHATSAPRRYADAARDHRAEVVDRQPRRWRSDATEIETLTAQNGLSFAQASGLAPTGYWLEHAKTCGIDGQRMLHLVFTNGTQEYSIYVGPHRSVREGVRIVRRNSEEVAGFETGRFRALVVTDGEAAECNKLARMAAERL